MPNCQILLNLYQTLLTAKHLFDVSLPSAKTKIINPDVKSGSRLERRDKFNKQTISQAVEAHQALESAYNELISTESIKELFTKLTVTVNKSKHHRLNEQIELNFTDTLTESREFYQRFNLPHFAVSLPNIMQIDTPLPERHNSTAREIIKKAMSGEYGGIVFDRAMVIPAMDIQEPNDPNPEIKEEKRQQVLTDLKTNLIRKLPGDTNPFLNPDAFKHPIDDSVKKERNGSNPNTKPKAYILLYSTDPIPCKGKTYPETQQEFTTNNWHGLTLPEALILQAKEQEKSNNHDFVAYDDNSDKSNWSWLLGARAGSAGCARVNWHPGSRRFEVAWLGAGSSNPSLGARPAVVVPIY